MPSPDSRSSAARRSSLLVGAVLLFLAALLVWKLSSVRAANAASANMPEQVEVVTAAPAVQKPHRATATAIGTVHALRSVTLRNELPGTVRQVRLTPGQIVEAGTVLVAL